MACFQIKPSLAFGNQVPQKQWLQQGRVFEGEYVAMKVRTVRIFSPDRTDSVEMPLSLLERVPCPDQPVGS